MQLPSSVKDAILEELETYLDTVDEPAVETVVQFVVDQLELAGDDLDLPDIIGDIEESGALDGPLADALTDALETEPEFVFTGDEIVSLFESLGAIEWTDED